MSVRRLAKEIFRRLGQGTMALFGAAEAQARLLEIEERLTLAPKQHLYLVRCGTRRMLMASAGESMLQWMAIPTESLPQKASLPQETSVLPLLREVFPVPAAAGSRRGQSRKRVADGGSKSGVPRTAAAPAKRTRQ